jgi:hypothetical protein
MQLLVTKVITFYLIKTIITTVMSISNKYILGRFHVLWLKLMHQTTTLGSGRFTKEAWSPFFSRQYFSFRITLLSLFDCLYTCTPWPIVQWIHTFLRWVQTGSCAGYKCSIWHFTIDMLRWPWGGVRKWFIFFLLHIIF